MTTTLEQTTVGERMATVGQTITKQTTKTALYTDAYEYKMYGASFRNNQANTKVVFEAFGRKLPEGVNYGIVCGIDTIIEDIRNFSIDTDTESYLRTIFSDSIVDNLKNYGFQGEVYAMCNGEFYLPNEPIVTVIGTFAECVVLETIILSALNSQSAIATHASRMRAKAGNRSLIEMGSRRIDKNWAVEAAKASYIGGFDATSNLQAGYKYGVPVVGTAAHAWTMLHMENELEAFLAQIDSDGVGTTLLVDTYNIENGIRLAVKATQLKGGNGPGAIRIDSGDLAIEAQNARNLLDSLGAKNTKIIVSGDITLETLDHLKDAPIDGYGIGTGLVITAPSLGIVYKLVAVQRNGTYIPVSKNSATEGKSTKGGLKFVYRDLASHTDTIVNKANGYADSLQKIVIAPHCQTNYQTSVNKSREKVRFNLPYFTKEFSKKEIQI